MRFVRHLFLLFAAVALCAAASPPAVQKAVQRYGSAPGGVTLEGTATGFEKLKSVAYDKKGNRFIINGNAIYANPVSQRDGLEILKALIKDDRIGVSLLPSTEVLTYGAISARSSVAQTLLDTDKLLGGVTFCRMDYVGDTKLPGNYRPKDVGVRQIMTAGHYNLTGFQFAKTGNVYKRSWCELEITLYVMSAKKAADGGVLPDEEATAAGRFEPEDAANRDHILANIEAYKRMDRVDRSMKLGELAAFYRFLRDSRVDLKALYKNMR